MNPDGWGRVPAADLTYPPPAPTPEPQPDPDPVVVWRTDQLVRAGADPVRATIAAENPAVDLHEAVRLLIAGCSPATMLRILL